MGNSVLTVKAELVSGTELLQSAAIQRAIDECFLRGGGIAAVPAGEYRVGGIRLRSGVTLKLEAGAVLRASRDPRDYYIMENDTLEPVDPSDLDDSDWERISGAPKRFHCLCSRWHNAIIKAYKAENIAVIGEEGSVIDGMNCYDLGGEEHYRGPHGMDFVCCRRITLRGYTIQNTGNWAHAVQNCSDILLEEVTALAGHDGVHFTTCDRATVRRCRFYTGDDCVAGFDNNGVLVEECELNTACSAFRMGGNGVLIQRCRAFAPSKFLFRGSLSLEEKISGVDAREGASAELHRYNMLSFFTYYADCSVKIRRPASGITVRDCIVEGADRLLHFNYSGNEMWQNNRPLQDIRFENIRAAGIELPLTAYGSAEEPLDICFEKVHVEFRGDSHPDAVMHAANCRRIRLKDFGVCGFRGKALIKCWDDRPRCSFEFENISGAENAETVRYTDEEFVCTPI